MSCLPFLLPLHQAPIASFPPEFLALLLAVPVLLATALRRNAAPLPLPAIAGAPLLLAALVAAQYFLGRFAYGASALLSAVFLIWAALLACAGQDASGDEPARLCDTLAGWLLAGALLNAGAGLLQYGGAWQALGGLVAAPPPDGREGVYGNLAQQNHFASHIAMGLAALAWLWQSHGWRGSRAAGAATAAMLLLVALALAGSRSGWLYLFVIAAALLWHAPSNARRRLLAGLAATALLLALLAAAAWHGQLGPQLARLTRLADPFGPRAFIWSHAWQMALAHPWLGVGWDNFAATLVGQVRPGERVWGIDQYAHNLFLQLLAAGGVPALLALLLPLAPHLRRCGGAPMLCWSVLGIVAVHSMLEQPLYYAYFLGPAAFLAGAMARPGTRCAPPARTALAVLAVLLLFGLLRAGRNYSEIREHVYAAALPPTPTLMQRLHQGSVFAPLLELAMPEYFVAADAPVAQRLAFNAKVRQFAPIAEVEFRHAVLLAEAGQEPASREQLRRAVRAYPAEAPAYLERVAALGAEARFAGLAQTARALAEQ
jgi:O-antigen ligase